MTTTKKDKNRPTFSISFSKEKFTPEQDREILAEYVFTLVRWEANEQLQKEAS